MSLDQIAYVIRHQEGNVALKHVEDVSDRSAPRIEPGATVHKFDKGTLLSSIEHGAELKHVPESQVHDCSTAHIDPDYHMQPSARPALLAEVQAVGGHHAVVSELKAAAEAGGPELKHVEEPADRSAPNVEGASVGKWDKGKLLAEIEGHKELKHVEGADRSAPLVEPDVKIKHHPHDELMKEVSSASPQALRHVEDPNDRSNPQVTHTAALRIHE
ncbi:hypothetical protein HYH03_000157 [Edaphochlamys debaryana]|uniref:WH2 domain-containing protein n=1 Tax=Edaphochlamys debaryana TaxID=47281 RepID=A0A835YI60_9CHLO|nr:hypothetical protein HYH03_000157 [Edaphochlamys debaryana]|eukprot:KAG2501653.1 hypothetical protein HYH03_000157 [Edaphochlamys debaryana]